MNKSNGIILDHWQYDGTWQVAQTTLY